MRILVTTLAFAVASPITAGVGHASTPENKPAATEEEPARSAPNSQAQRFRDEARAQFDTKDYRGAIESFSHAHWLDPEPTDLFNMGRVYEELGELKQALSLYRAFAEQPNLALGERAAAAERIEVLAVLVETEFEPEPAPQPTARLTDDRGKRKKPRERQLISSGAGMTGAGTVAAIAGGLGFGIAASRTSSQVSVVTQGNPDRLTLAQAEDLQARGKEYEALQIASIAVGGAVAVIGLTVLTVGLVRKRKRQRPGATTASLRAGQPFAPLIWRF